METVRAAIAKRPHDHVLVNNAGTNKPQPFTEVDIDIYDSVIALNLRAAFFMAQAVAKRMITGKEGGSIIHTSSTDGARGDADARRLLRIEIRHRRHEQGDGA